MTPPDQSIAGGQGDSPSKTVTKVSTEIVTVLGALVLPLVGAHFLFYSQLRLSPSDVGLDFGDLVQRSAPGLIGILLMVSVLVVGLYSIVIWMNVLFLPFVVGPVTRLVRRVSLGALGVALLLSLIPPLQGMAGWILPIWVVSMTAVGCVVVVKHWKEMVIGLLIGAPAYVVLQAMALLLVSPALTRYVESTPAGSDPSLATLLLLLPALVFLAFAYTVLLLPALLVMGADSERTGAGWVQLRSIRRYLTIRRAGLGFACFALAATHLTICALAFWNAEAIKRGWDPGIFGSAGLDEIVQHTYGLPVTCVAVTQVKPYPRRLPGTAIRLGNRREADHALVWDRSGAVMVPNDVAQLTPILRPACIPTP